MTHLFIHCLRSILLTILIAASGQAGEYFEKEGLAIGGYDPVAYFTELKPVKGSELYRVDYQGSVFLFTSSSNRDRFLAHPEKFAPQYGGYCAYGMAKGYKAATDHAAFTVVGDRLFLNYNGTVRALWILDIQGFIKKADHNWAEVRKTTKIIN